MYILLVELKYFAFQRYPSKSISALDILLIKANNVSFIDLIFWGYIMELKNIKFLLIIYLIGAFPLAVLGSSNVFASSPMINNQSFSVKGVGNYFEDFTDQTYRSG